MIGGLSRETGDVSVPWLVSTSQKVAMSFLKLSVEVTIHGQDPVKAFLSWVMSQTGDSMEHRLYFWTESFQMAWSPKKITWSFKSVQFSLK
jgi:hypothetical protein